MKNMPEFVVALTTCPKNKSEEIAQNLVKEQVCACVNIIPSVKSIYHWENEIITDEESLLIMKTQEKHKEVLWETIKKIHPYKVPEYVILQIKWGSKDYLNWIAENTSGLR
jgi:periplasmic divalent cation tolerance protein